MTELLYSEDAEQAVLSAMMSNERAIVALASTLDGSHFYRESHRRLFDAITHLHAVGTKVDPITLAAQLTVDGDLDRIGGKDYIGYLLDVIPSLSDGHAVSHAAIVRQRAAQRQLLEVVRHAAKRLEEGANPQDIGRHLFDAALPYTIDARTAGFRHIRELLYDTMDAIEKRSAGGSGLKTGYAGIDNHTAGFRPGEMVVPGGAEKSGKSALAFNIAMNVLEKYDGTIGVGYVSAEMTADSLVERAIARKARIESGRLASGTIIDNEWVRLARASGELAGMPLYIDDEAEPSIADVEARCTHLKALHPEIGLIVVDFLQIITAHEKGLSDAVEIKRVAYGIKRMAKRLGIVAIAPCQVNTKDVETTKDMRPRLKDLQGSSGIRQAADFVALIYRPGLYDEHATDADTMELDFAACRRTPRFTARLRWNGSTMTISE